MKTIRKDRSTKSLIQFFAEKNLKREFQIECLERGVKATHVLNKFLVEFCRKNETKTLK